MSLDFQRSTLHRIVKSIATHLSTSLLLAGLALAAATHAPAQEYTFVTLAGPPEAGLGAIDGTGSATRFDLPQGVAVDSAGNVYVADSGNNTIRKVTPGGVVTTLAGLAGNSGSADGTGGAARFNGPWRVAVDSAGNVYVADSDNNTIRKVTPGGEVTTLAGLAGSYGSADGPGSAARFSQPAGVAVDSADNVYVADTGNSTIRKVTPGGVVTTLAGGFNQPSGVAVDSAGNVYVADTVNSTIRKVTPGGVVTTLAGLAGSQGSTDGTGSAARFCYPQSVAVDSAGNVYVADANNYSIRKVTPAGAVSTLAGLAASPGSADGTGSAARFSGPCGVAVDSAGIVYVADNGNCTIRKVTPGGVVTTLAGLTGIGGSADGTGSAARFYIPYGAAVDSAGNVYVADTYNLTVRKVTPGGVVTTLAGLAGVWGSADGTGSAARFQQPGGVAVDSADNVYVADTWNNTIRKVTPGCAVTTVAGLAGTSGSADGTGSAARFWGPSGVAVDSAGNVYVADADNNTIRKVTPGGVVTTLAGLAGSQGSADGTGSAARFYYPQSVAVDSAGNVDVADTGNSTIRKVTPGGVVTTLAGLPGTSGTNDGTGSAARFAAPHGVAVDSAGIVYVADMGTSTIRKVTPGGMVTTLAGLAGTWGGADGTGSAARFDEPYGVAVDSADNVYVADTYNSTIRIGTTKTCPDAPTIDLALGPVGQLRQLDTSPQTAVAWQWRLIRAPSASSASLSAANVRNPTFTPDVADLYLFRLSATNAAGAICIRTLAFTAAPAPTNMAPQLTQQPAGVRVPLGANFTLSVAASGSWPLAYQWFHTGQPVSGAISDVFSVTNAALSDSGDYQVTVSNSVGVATSQVAHVVVGYVLTLTTNGGGSIQATPAPEVYEPGQTVQLAAIPGAGHTFLGWQGDASGTNNPVTLSMDGFKQVTAVFSLRPAGTVVAWGDNSSGQTNVPPGLSGVTAVAAGYSHSLALRQDGTVVAWGSNGAGETTVPKDLSGVVAIAGGTGHSLALAQDGTIVAWGFNDYGEAAVPSGLSGVIGIAAGYFHNLALRQDGTVLAWGAGEPGPSGSPNYNYGQAKVPNDLSGVIAIAGGAMHSLAVKQDGTVVAWGDNYYGEATVPAGLSGVIAVAGGEEHSLALKQDGTVVAWGANKSGQTAVPSGLSGVIAIAAGSFHSLALKQDGTVVAWGDNYYGEATVRSGLSGVIAIAAGGGHNLALVSPPPPTNTPPQITQQPAGLRVPVGTNFTLQVSASSSLPLTYQWYHAGQSVSGAVLSVLSVTNAALSDSGDYWVTVSNSMGGAASQVAQVVVGYSLTLTTTNGMGSIQAAPALDVYAPGQTVQLTATPGAGCTFVGWQGDASGTNNPLTLMMDGSKRVEAVFSTKPGTLKWAFQTWGQVSCSAGIGQDGTIYIGSLDKWVYALDPVTGQEKWAVPTGNHVYSCPAIGADGTVYFGSDDFNVYALDGITGNKKWAFPTGAFVYSSPAIGDDGTVFVGSQDQRVYALDGATGQKKWEFLAGNSVSSSPALGDDGTVYFGSWDGRVYALDGTTGQKKWEFATGSKVSSSPALGDDGTLYIGSWDDKVYALDGATGQEEWEFLTGREVNSSPIIGADGTVYVGSEDGKVYALDGTTGLRKWAFATGGNVGSSPALGADGTLYVGSGGWLGGSWSDTRVYALDGATGQEKWEFATGMWVDASPAIGTDGTIYIGSNDGSFYALESSSLGGLADSPWPKFRQNAQNSGQHLPFAPKILWQPSQALLREGATCQIGVEVAGLPAPSLLWFFNGQPISGATQATLTLLSVTRAAEGLYTLVASNRLGQVTSQPIPAVVSNVDPQSFIGLKWEGGSGGPVSLEATRQLGAAASWHSLSNYPSSGTTQLYVELDPADAARFYRLNAADPLRFSAAGWLNGWWLPEPAGSRVLVEVVSAATGWTNWQVLTNLTLPASPFLFLDSASLCAPGRVYRTTLEP